MFKAIVEFHVEKPAELFAYLTYDGGHWVELAGVTSNIIDIQEKCTVSVQV